MKIQKLLSSLVQFHQNNLQQANLTAERGGIICQCSKSIAIKEFPNQSLSYKEYQVYLAKPLLQDPDTIGLWHTQEKYTFPSLCDIKQMIFLNIRYHKNFYLVIFSTKTICLVSFWALVIPWISFPLTCYPEPRSS